MHRRVIVLVCRGPECGDKRNSAAVHAEFAARLRAEPPADVEVALDWQSCFGRCPRGVNVMVREVRPGDTTPLFGAVIKLGPGSALYNAVRPDEVGRIVREHVAGARVIPEFKNREEE